jgi:hypothetical protein
MYEQLALPLLDEPATEPTPPATPALEYDPVLFGKDPTPYIVAVEPIDARIRLFIREGGQTRTVEEPFRPWLLSDMRMAMDSVHWEELKGELEGRRMLKYLAVCDGREAFETCAAPCGMRIAKSSPTVPSPAST